VSDRDAALRCIEKLPHGWGRGGISRQLSYAEAFEHQAKNTLMLIESDGLVAPLGQRTDDHGRYVAAAGSEVKGIGFIEDNDEQAVLLELRALYERVDVGLEPGIGCAERAVVRVITEIRDDEGKVGQIGGVPIGSELTERHEVSHLGGIALHVGEIGERVVADGVTAGIAPRVADRRNIFGVRLPGLACCEEVTDDVLRGDREVARRGGVDKRENVSCSELEVIWD